MSRMVRFSRQVCGSFLGVRLLQSTIDPECELMLERDGGDNLITGAAPEGSYLLLFEIVRPGAVTSKQFKLMKWELSSKGSSFAEGIGLPGQIGGWMFDEESGTTHSDAWERRTAHRTGELVLQPGAHLQLEAMQNLWSPDTYIQKLDAALEDRGLMVCYGGRSISVEVMNVSNLLNDLDRGARAIETMKKLSSEICAELAWQPKGSAKPLYSLVDSGNPARGYAFQLAAFFHHCLDWVEPYIGLVPRDELINRV